MPTQPKKSTGVAQPHVAEDVQRCTGVMLAALSIFSVSGYTASTAVSDLITGARNTQTPNLRRTTIDTTIASVRKHLFDNPLSTPKDILVNLSAQLSGGQVQLVLEDAWDNVTPTCRKVDDAVTAANQAGLDGEGVTSAVIRVVSLTQIGLVWHAANRLERTFASHTSDDLFGVGWIGLCHALRRFDPTLGYAFSTFAIPKIQGAMRDRVRAEDPLPKRLTTERNKAKAAVEALSQELGRNPTLSELTDSVGHQLAVMLPRLTPAASIEELCQGSDDNEVTPAWMVSDDLSPEEYSMNSVLKDAVETALEHLTESENQAVRLVDCDGLTPVEAGKEMGIPSKQVRALCTSARSKLRVQLADWAPAA